MGDPEGLYLTTCPACDADVWTVHGEPDALCQTCSYADLAGMPAARVEHVLCGADAPTESEALAAFAATGEYPF